MVLPYIYICQNELKRKIDLEENEAIKDACQKGQYLPNNNNIYLFKN
jgi:hypothetical protein